MKKLYPIKFISEPRERVWGGNYLMKKLKKEFDPEYQTKHIGESWELWSLYGGSSVASNGFLAGNSLDEIIEIYMGDAIGEEIFNYYRGVFPLLFKFLDVKDKLSVQVHPNNQIAMEREDSFGKDEMWFVMDAKPGAKILMGFNKDVTPTEFYNRCKDGTVEEIMNVFTPKKGDCFFIESGCVHTACGEIVIAEIQQSSDISYRLYDWGRENNPKTARKMSLEEAIDVIDYKKYNREKYYLEQVSQDTVLVESQNFIIKYINLNSQKRVIPALINSFIVYTCLNGKAHIQMNNGESYSIAKGETLFIPASMDDFLLIPDKEQTELIETYMPKIEQEYDNYLNYDEVEDEAHGSYKDNVEDDDHCHSFHSHCEDDHCHCSDDHCDEDHCHCSDDAHHANHHHGNHCHCSDDHCDEDHCHCSDDAHHANHHHGNHCHCSDDHIQQEGHPAEKFFRRN